MYQSIEAFVDSLYVVKGRLRGIQRWKGKINELTVLESKEVTAAALGAAVSGSAAAAVGGMQSIGNPGRDVTYFSAKIGSVPISGYFQLANFEDGDEVEAVISNSPDSSGFHRCVAVARLSDSILWTCGTGEGYKIERRKRRIFVGGLTVGAYFLLFLLSFSNGSIPHFQEFVLGVGAVICTALGLTHRGKLPALPGDSPRFDLCDGLREFLISAKRKEIHNERVSEPKPYEMGLQISRGIHSEASKETDIRSVASAFG